MTQEISKWCGDLLLTRKGPLETLPTVLEALKALKDKNSRPTFYEPLENWIKKTKLTFSRNESNKASSYPDNSEGEEEEEEEEEEEGKRQVLHLHQERVPLVVVVLKKLAREYLKHDKSSEGITPELMVGNWLSYLYGEMVCALVAGFQGRLTKEGWFGVLEKKVEGNSSYLIQLVKTVYEVAVTSVGKAKEQSNTVVERALFLYFGTKAKEQQARMCAPRCANHYSVCMHKLVAKKAELDSSTLIYGAFLLAVGGDLDEYAPQDLPAAFSSLVMDASCAIEALQMKRKLGISGTQIGGLQATVTGDMVHQFLTSKLQALEKEIASTQDNLKHSVALVGKELNLFT